MSFAKPSIQKRPRKQHCALCRNHGVMSEKKGHICPHQFCPCKDCHIEREIREVMKRQIQLKRQQRTKDSSLKMKTAQKTKARRKTSTREGVANSEAFPTLRSPSQRISPLLGRLSTSENSAFVKFSPRRRMPFEAGISATETKMKRSS